MSTPHALTPDPGNFKATALAALSAAGFARAVVSFEGGHDEGGADSVVATTADGREVELPLWEDDLVRDALGHYIPVGTDADGRTLFKRRERSGLGHLSMLLQRPVEERYGSFAGDFFVSGQVTYNAEAGTVTISGDEEMPVTTGFEEEV